MTLAPVRIPQLQQSNPIVDSEGRMSNEFARRLNDIFFSLASAVNGVILAQNAAAMAIAAAATAQAAASAAQTSADTATAQNRDQSLASSGIMPRTVVSGNASGNITIAAHTRYYGDGTSVSVNGGSIGGYSAGDEVYVSYLDPMRTGGTVMYLGSSMFEPQTGDRHVVGSITLPTTGSAPGEPGPAPPGGG